MKTKPFGGFAVVVLAAGRGTRMGLLTRDIPKCLLSVGGRTILDRQLSVFARADARSIEVVGGHGFSRFCPRPNVSYSANEQFETTNMVFTLFRSKTVKENSRKCDVVISYGDIVFSDEVLASLLDSNAEVSVVVDTEWLSLWQQRFTDPLEDAETLRYDETGMITELGRKPDKIEDIMGQYIGLIKFRVDMLEKIGGVWSELQQGHFSNQEHPERMFMTAFLQLLIDLGVRTEIVPISGGWMEFDSPSDLELYERHSGGPSPETHPAQ